MRKLGQHPVDRVFDSRLQSAEMPVSNKVWGQISSELEKDQLRRKVFWYRSVAVASVALLIGLGTWMLLQPTLEIKQFAGAQKVTRQSQLPAFAERQCKTAFAKLRESIQFNPNALPVQKLRNSSLQSSPLLSPQAPLHETPQGLQGTMADKVREALEQATHATEVLRTQLAPRTPSLLGNVVGDRNRSLPFAELGNAEQLKHLPTPSKHKEREFTFVLEEDADKDAEKDATRQRRWEVGAGFSPDMTFASTTPLEQTSRSASALADDPTQANTNQLSPVVAYAAVVRTSLELDERWSLRTGLSFMNRQTSTAADVTVSGKNTTTYQSNLDLYSLELPLSVKYNVLHEEDFDYYVTTGISGNFFLHYDNYLQTSDGNIASRRSSLLNEAFKPSQASLLFSTGLRYRLLDHLSLQLEPGIRYGVIRNEYAFSQSRPVSTSLLSGLTYHF